MATKGSEQGYGQPFSNPSVVAVGNPVSNVIVTAKPSDYLGFALFTCLCCFWPTGIAAIVFAWNSKSSSDRQDYAKAQSEGNMAKIFSIISLVIGLIWIIAVIIYVIVLFAVVANAYSTANSISGSLLDSLDSLDSAIPGQSNTRYL